MVNEKNPAFQHLAFAFLYSRFVSHPYINEFLVVGTSHPYLRGVANLGRLEVAVWYSSMQIIHR